jgi:hypothetical protein
MNRYGVIAPRAAAPTTASHLRALNHRTSRSVPTNTWIAEATTTLASRNGQLCSIVINTSVPTREKTSSRGDIAASGRWN